MFAVCSQSLDIYIEVYIMLHKLLLVVESEINDVDLYARIKLPLISNNEFCFSIKKTHSTKANNPRG